VLDALAILLALALTMSIGGRAHAATVGVPHTGTSLCASYFSLTEREIHQGQMPGLYFPTFTPDEREKSIAIL
jgi:hypothetical protein